MDPSMLRNSANMMKNMDQNQFNNMKNAVRIVLPQSSKGSKIG